jgi:hypothetical protein
MVRFRNKWVTDLQGHCVQAHIPEVSRDLGRTGEDFGRVRGSVWVRGRTAACHSVKPVEVAAMRKVCRVGGWEIPSEFSLNPPNSPGVLMDWRALIELLELMPASKRDALCSLRFPLASSQGFESSWETPAVRPKVVRPEEPMDWTQGRMSSGGCSVRRVPGEGQSNATSLGDEGWWVLGTSGRFW